MLGFLASAFVATVVVTGFGYFAHKCIHARWAGYVNKGHMTHHQLLYPSDDFFSEKYRSPGKDNTAFVLAIAGLPLLATPAAGMAFGLLSLKSGFIIIAQMLVIGYLHDYLHDSFHILNHDLNRFTWFQKLVELHKVHHSDMTKNFGIFSFAWDKMFGTFLQG